MTMGKVLILAKQDKHEKPIKKKTIPEQAIKEFDQALLSATEKISVLEEKLTSTLPPEELEIYSSYRAMINDPEVIEKTKDYIKTHHCNAAFAFDQISTAFVVMLEELEDPYLRQRAEDLKMISKTVLEILQGKTTNHQVLHSPTIIVAEKIDPNQLAALDQKNILGLITTQGGITDHTAIVAKALGIPYILGIKNIIQKIRPNDFLVLDSNRGCVYQNPSKKEIDHFKTQIDLKQRQAEQALLSAQTKAYTKSGKTLEVLANVGSVEDAHQALKFGADGIGLLRTELCFLERSSFPDEAAHFEQYTQILNELPDKTYTLRLLDFGTDKKVSYLHTVGEENPALGLRALRLGFSNYDTLLKPQIRAFLRLSKNYAIKILCPMIANNQDLDQIIEAIKSEQQALNAAGEKIKKLPPIGIMVEVPNVAINPQKYIAKADFFSFGTNDLAQFLMAADRTNENVSNYLSTADQTLIQLIENFTQHAQEQKKEISICGELASNANYLSTFIKMGLHALSMPPKLIPTIKAKINSLE